MDIVLLVLLAFIGVQGLRKGRVKISSKKEIRGQRAKALSIIFILAGVGIVLRGFMGLGGTGPLLGIAGILAVVIILFVIFGQEDIVSS